MYRRRQEAAEKDEKTEVSTATGQPPSQKSMLEDALSLPISFSLFLWLTHKYTASTLCSNYKKTHTHTHKFMSSVKHLEHLLLQPLHTYHVDKSSSKNI